MGGERTTFITPLDVVADSDLEGVGTVRREGDNEYIWCKGVASTAVGSVVVLDEDYATALITTALGAVPRRVAIAMAAIVANKWGWYQIRGIGSVLGVASCAADVALYTDTSNAGHVDDTAVSEHPISNITLNDAVGGGGNALAACKLSYPWTLPQLD